MPVPATTGAQDFAAWGWPIRAMIIPDIEEWARWSIVENDKEGPVVSRWSPHPGHLHQNVVSDGTPMSPEAEIFPGGVTERFEALSIDAAHVLGVEPYDRP